MITDKILDSFVSQEEEETKEGEEETKEETKEGEEETAEV